MFLKENFLLALAGLRANKMRALLTMLGIIIGISSVIAIVSVGNALTASLTETMAAFGTSNITVFVRAKGSGNINMGETRSVNPADSDYLTGEQIEAFREKFGNRIEDVEMSDSLGNGKAKDGRLYANVNVVGVNTGFRNTQNVKMSQGRFINENDIKGTKRVAVVSDRFAENMFGDKEPLGQEVKITTGDTVNTYRIVGVYKYEPLAFAINQGSEKDRRTDLYTSITVVKAEATYKNYPYFTVKAAQGVDSKKLVEDIREYFKKVYVKNGNWQVWAASNEGMISNVTSMLDKISLAISVIAAISLLVGGIGVMNIMLVAVTERTREIGTRKALGARSSYIKVQFIVEAMIICGIGGVIGVILGIIVGAFGAMALNAPVTVSIPIILISVTFSMIIGIFFGYYPANKAAQLDPIEALRYE